MAFFHNNEKSKFKSKPKRDNRNRNNAHKPQSPREKGNTPSYVLMKIEQCISVAGSASSVKIITDKLYEASGYIAELAELEKKGFYKGNPKAADYIKSFVQRKDFLLMEGIKRALAAGESKEKILANEKFLTDEMKDYINHQ